MYQPPVFREERPEILHALMRAHPFATLVTLQAGDICADHLPLMIHDEASPYGTLRGHVARANPLWNAGADRALAIFQGPQTYITPSWYPSKREHGKVVPTWNYAIVQAHGTLRFIEDHDWLLDHLTVMTGRQESDRPEPWQVTDAPDDYLARQLTGIVGLELVITRLDGKWKVSQNREARDRDGVRRGLSEEPGADAAAMADLVARAMD